MWKKWLLESFGNKILLSLNLFRILCQTGYVWPKKLLVQKIVGQKIICIKRVFRKFVSKTISEIQQIFGKKLYIDQKEIKVKRLDRYYFIISTEIQIQTLKI